MKILVIGSGGREHALVWKLAQSAKGPELFCAPGNAGIRAMATCVDIAANDIPGLLDFARTEGIDLTVVGPEEPLTLGIVDVFRKEGLRIFGPDSKGAVLEGSKVFTKDFLARHNIPSARYKSFTKHSEAKKYLGTVGMPCVVKADGLAAGKGVIIAHTVAEAEQAVDLIMRD